MCHSKAQTGLFGTQRHILGGTGHLQGEPQRCWHGALLCAGATVRLRSRAPSRQLPQHLGIALRSLLQTRASVQGVGQGLHCSGVETVVGALCLRGVWHFLGHSVSSCPQAPTSGVPPTREAHPRPGAQGFHWAQPLGPRCPPRPPAVPSCPLAVSRGGSLSAQTPSQGGLDRAPAAVTAVPPTRIF